MELKDSWRDFLALTVDHGFVLASLLHHRLATLVAGLAPDVHDVVVAFLGRDQTRQYCLSISFTFAAGFGQDGLPCRRASACRSMAIEIPARVARRKPDCSSLSAKITVSRADRT